MLSQDESQNPQTSGSSQPDSKFPILRKPLVVALILFGVALILLVPLIFFISGSIKSNQSTKPDTAPPTSNDPFLAPYVPDELIVKYKSTYTLEELENLKTTLDSIGVIEQKKLFDDGSGNLENFYVLTFKEGVDVKEAKERLDMLPEIESVSPNTIVTANETPNDPNYGQQWGFAKINMPAAWGLSKGTNPVVIAVIDTGIDFNHPDFAGRSLIKGYDYANKDNDPQDDNGHGTHVSGTIGAATNNSLGVSGVNWNNSVSIMGIKVLNAAGSGDSSMVLNGIKYAADHGADIINMSLGGNWQKCTNVAGYQSVIDYANSKGVLIIVAAGNTGKNPSTGKMEVVDVTNPGAVPPSCNGVLVVGNTTQTDTRATSSNYGTKVDIAAPGTSILSTYKNGGYATLTGTSMAAPHVAGVAAMLLSVKAGLSAAQIKSCLLNNADPISTDLPIGNKRLNALKVISACSGLTAATPTTKPAPTLAAGVTPTGIPVPPTTAPTQYRIYGEVFIDNNNNGKKDSGDPGLANVPVTTVGTQNLTVNSDSNGSYNINVVPGTYSVNAKYNNTTITTRNSRTLGGTATTLPLSFPFPPEALVTLAPNEPTKAPIIVDPPVVVVKPTATPTKVPIQTYTCRQRTGGIVNSKTITIGDLVCTPNP